jgi:hypothetical protein
MGEGRGPLYDDIGDTLVSKEYDGVSDTIV